MRIGINFGDNDFYNTFMPFMKIIVDAINYNDSFEATKENIVDIFNSMSLSLYKLFQSRYDRIESNDEHYDKYLKIKTSDIYLDEEIDEKLKTYNSWANGSFFYADTDNKQTDCW